MKTSKSLLILISLIGLMILSPQNQARAVERVSAKSGMVACSERNASEIGFKILREGGNAVDAAVAMSLALAVTYPGAGNIGGGGYLLLSKNDGTVSSVDFREKAPLRSHERMFLDERGRILKNSNHEGILSAGVPGTIAGLEWAHKKYGKWPWEKLVEPALNLAKNGFKVSPYLSDNFKLFKAGFLKYPSSAGAFLKNDGSIYAPGEIWRQPDLAETLQRLRSRGQEDFYRGKTAELIGAYVRKEGGLITGEDLQKYAAVERKPIHCTYRGYDVYAMGPSSSGGVVLAEMLNILEGYDLKGLGRDSVPYWHVLTETMRLAYLDRARYLGDIEANPNIPLDRLTSKEYAAQLRRGIPLDRASDSRVEDVRQLSESPHTTHLSVWDAEGLAVSLTYTIEGWFGSEMVVEGAGFLLNNEMGDFNPIPDETDDRGNIGTPPNLIAPEKRMLSSMCPTILLKDKRPFLVLGAPGGRTIPNTVLQVILNVVDFGLDISEAIARKRIHHQWMPDITILEEGVFSAETRKKYEKLGHKTSFEKDMAHNEAMGIIFDKRSRTIRGCADPRSPDGSAIGDR